jgi:hypothetical protein
MSEGRLDDVHGHVVVQMLGREDAAAVVGQEHERCKVPSIPVRSVFRRFVPACAPSRSRRALVERTTRVPGSFPAPHERRYVDIAHIAVRHSPMMQEKVSRF